MKALGLSMIVTGLFGVFAMILLSEMDRLRVKSKRGEVGGALLIILMLAMALGGGVIMCGGR